MLSWHIYSDHSFLFEMKVIWFYISLVLCSNTPGRLFVAVFWFCILIWVSTYTANLAAFFTVKRVNTLINNIEDALQSDHTIGVARGASTYSFFKSSKYQLYREIWNRMEAAGSFSNSSVDGIERARNDPKYIHIGDGPMLEYAERRLPCNIVTGK